VEPDNDNWQLPRTRAEAQEIGSLYYFTGKPCSHGHLSKRYTNSIGCVECAISRAKERYWSNPEAKSAYDRARYATNPAARLGYNKWKIENPDKAQEARDRWKENNPDKHREAQRKWAANNPETVQANVRARRARKRDAEGSHTKDDIETILVRQKFKCAECGADIKKRSNRQVDHIIPLKLGGSNWPSNLQILCCTCNKVKAAKHPLDFAAERGRLV